MIVPRIAADSRTSTKAVLHQLDQTPNYPNSTTWLSRCVFPISYESTHTVCTGIYQSVQLPTVLALRSSSGSLPKRPLPLPSFKLASYQKKSMCSIPANRPMTVLTFQLAQPGLIAWQSAHLLFPGTFNSSFNACSLRARSRFVGVGRCLDIRLFE